MEADLSDDASSNRTLERYRCAYEAFMKWHGANGYTTFDEDVLIAYLNNAAKTYQSATLKWIHSMLKRSLFTYNNIDIRSYTGLNNFFKDHTNVGQERAKGKVFSFEEINRFLVEAPDEHYLAMKVIMIFAVSGGCSCDDLQNMKTENVKDCGTEIIVSSSRNRKSAPPIFLISGEFAKSVQKYMHRRPTKMPTNRFFLQYSQGEYDSQLYTIKKLSMVPKEIAKFLKLDDYKSYTVHSFQPANHGRKKQSRTWKLQLSSDITKQLSTTATTTTKKASASKRSLAVEQANTKLVVDMESVIIKSEFNDTVSPVPDTDIMLSELTNTSNQNYHKTEENNEPFLPMLSSTMALITWKSQYYTGIQQNQLLKLLQMVNDRKLISDVKLMLTLRKLRLDENIEVLADVFDLDRATAEKYFNESKHQVIELLQSVANSTSAPPSHHFSGAFDSIIKTDKCEIARAPDPIVASGDSSTSEMDDVEVQDDFEVILPEADETKENPGFLSADLQRRTAKCPICNKLYEPRLLNTHMNSVHFNIGNLNRTICGLCWKECETKASLKAHQKDVHGGGSYGCDICGKIFRSKQYLSVHILTKHARVNTYLCDTCGEGFPTPYFLQDHNKKKHSEPAHACHLCDMKFVTALPLKDHIVARHTNERPYKCLVKGCGKTFSWPSSLKSHRRVHVRDKFECSICLKDFSFKGNLRNHLKIIHNRIVDNRCLTSKFFGNRLNG